MTQIYCSMNCRHQNGGYCTCNTIKGNKIDKYYEKCPFYEDKDEILRTRPEKFWSEISYNYFS